MTSLKSRTKKILLSTLVASSLVTSAFATTPFIDGNFSTANLDGITMYNVFYENQDNQWFLVNSEFTDTNETSYMDINVSDTHFNDYTISSGMLSFLDDENTPTLVKITDYNSSVLTVCWEPAANIDSCTEGGEYYFSDKTEATTFINMKNAEIVNVKVAEFDIDKDAQYSKGDTIYMQFDKNITISEFGINQVSVTNSKTFGTDANVSAVATDANISDMMGFTTPINNNTYANTFVLTLGAGTDVSSGDNILIDSTNVTALDVNASFPLLAVVNADDIGAEVQMIRDDLAAATDIPEDMRTTIETILAEIDVLLENVTNNESQIIEKLGMIYSMKDMMGDDDALMYGTDASTITGTITIPTGVTLTDETACFDTTTYMPLPSCNAVFVDLKGTNGEWLGSTMIDSDGSYTLYFRELADSETIDATLEIHAHLDGIEEHYFYDFGDNHLVGTDDSIKSGMEIDWIEDTATGMWNPDVNHLTISTAETTLNVDISNMDAGKYILEGTVQVPADFTPGEIWNTTTGAREGFQMVNLTAINTRTGDHYWTEIGRTETSTDNDTYPFKFKLPSDNNDSFIIRIEKMSDTNGAFEWVEMYLNDGSDNEFNAVSGSDDSLVGATGVMWNETSQGSNIWIPDTTKTGYFTVNANVSNIAIDITTFGSDFYKIAGSITPPTDFDTSSYNDNINIDIIDAKTGMWLGGSPMMCDSSDNCTYSVVLGDTLNNYDGSDNGGYIIQLHQNHWDDTDWANSWWKEFYFDLGTDNAVGGVADTIKDSMDVRWSESNELDTYGNPYWKPDVNEFKIASATDAADVTDVNISFGDNYTITETYTISGTITGIPADAKWANVHIYDPINYIGNGTELNADGTYTIQNVKNGKYILEVNYDVDDGGNYKHYHYIITDDNGDFSAGTTTAVDGMDIRWIPYDSNAVSLETNTSSSTFDWTNVAYWAPKETSSQKVMLDVNADVDVVSLAITQATFYDLTVALTGAGNAKNVNFNLFVPNEPIGRWENNISTAGGDSGVVLKDLKDRTQNDYQLQIWIDGLGEFWYDDANETLVSDVTWVGYQDDAICENWKENISTCNWENFVEWKPNLAGFSITSSTAIATLANLAVPSDRATITAVLAMGVEDANKTFDVNMWQHSGNNYAWESFEANASGDVTVSLSVKQGLDYRMEVYNPQNWEGFVVDLGSNAQDSGDESLITNQNSWATDGAWGPKTTTLIDLEDANLTDGVLDLGTLTPPTLKSVTFTVANLELDGATITEDIWIGLENNTTNEWYGNGNADWADWTNPTYSNEVTVKVPASATYFVHIYPMSHKGGMVDVNGSGQGVIAVNSNTATINFATAVTTWDITDADTIAIADNTAIALTLKDMDTYKSILGTVTLNGDVSESGWICAWNETTNDDGQCTEVNTDGTYTIKGLSPTSNGDDYLVEYWANSGENFRTLEDWTDITNNLTVDISFVAEANNLVTILGTVADSDITSKPNEVLVLEVQDSDVSWKVIESQAIDLTENGTAVDFNISNIAPALAGTHYEIAVGSADMNATTGEATYTINDRTSLDSTEGNATTVTDDATVTITITQP